MTEAKTETAYAYGLTGRPPQLGAVPRGYYVTPGTTRNVADYEQAFRFGTLYYPEPLNDHDVYSYELTPAGTATLICSDQWNAGYEWGVTP